MKLHLPAFVSGFQLPPAKCYTCGIDLCAEHRCRPVGLAMQWPAVLAIYLPNPHPRFLLLLPSCSSAPTTVTPVTSSASTTPSTLLSPLLLLLHLLHLPRLLQHYQLRYQLLVLGASSWRHCSFFQEQFVNLGTQLVGQFSASGNIAPFLKKWETIWQPSHSF